MTDWTIGTPLGLRYLENVDPIAPIAADHR